MFPEILKSATEFRTAEGDDCVGSTDSPVHAGSLQSCAHGDFATGLKDTGRGAEALFVELWVPHAVTIASADARRIVFGCRTIVHEPINVRAVGYKRFQRNDRAVVSQR